MGGGLGETRAITARVSPKNLENVTFNPLQMPWPL